MGRVPLLVMTTSCRGLSSWSVGRAPIFFNMSIPSTTCSISSRPGDKFHCHDHSGASYYVPISVCDSYRRKIIHFFQNSAAFELFVIDLCTTVSFHGFQYVHYKLTVGSLTYQIKRMLIDLSLTS